MEGLIRRSDMVLCPVNCISHNTCLNVKKLCNEILQVRPDASQLQFERHFTGIINKCENELTVHGVVETIQGRANGL